MRSVPEPPVGSGQHRAGRERFPVVGLGASAGGLAPLELFFERMPPDSGMAFVVVTHRHQAAPSLLAELLRNKTRMPVTEVTQDTPLEIDHVYTAGPGFKLTLAHGILHPVSISEGGSAHLPIDYFFRSLAHERKERAIAIILSGTGSDGTLGLTEIKGELGLVMVQDEHTASYPGMPQSALATEMVDLVLPVTEMPARLQTYVKSLTAPHAAVVQSELVKRVLGLIREKVGHDFTHYKQSTIVRRIERRMTVQHCASLPEYLNYMQAHPAEIELLFKDLLIGVTAFFRDAQAWDALASCIRELLTGKPDEYVLRAWVVGCSTGEEAYSLAIVLRELEDTLQRPIPAQIFATDLNSAAIEAARAAAYPLGIVHDVTPERMARYFSLKDEAFHVVKDVREMVVFASQNLLADPPFTKLDLVCCRNVLIYLEGQLQQRLFPLLHYSLKADGLLFLGTSGSIASAADLFRPIDKRWKIYRRNEVALGTYATDFPAGVPAVTAAPRAPVAVLEHTDTRYLGQLVQRMLLDELVPPTVIVHEWGDVVHVHGRTGAFLEPSPGAPSHANIFNMVRPGLQVCLAAALRQAATSDAEVVRRSASLQADGQALVVDVRAVRLREPPGLRGLLRVTFEQVACATAESVVHGGERSERESDLERELQYTRESHQSTVAELHTAHEELKSTNEELVSTNEELQSANEELQTSKEELQSLNEELQTVNAELQGKVEELSHANNDMKNLLNATDIATIFLDRELCIKRFTEQAKRIMNLIPSDVARPIGDLAPSVRYDHLVADAREVLQTLTPKEAELEAEGGAQYLMRILPYRTTDNVIDGIVITFIDITALKQLQGEHARLHALLDNSTAGFFGQDQQQRYTWVFSSVFGHKAPELIGKHDREVFEPADAEALGKLKQEVFSTGLPLRRRIELRVRGARRLYELYMESQRDQAGDVVGLSCLAMDVTNTA